MVLTQKRLRQLLGLLWLIDGLLQLQPQMFTMNMVNSVMVPTVQAQPAPVAASLSWIIQVTTQNLTLVNLSIAIIQILIGIGLISGKWVRGTLVISIIWALVVWYGGEGMSMLLTGQASALTGAPGAVLLYALLALVLYPRQYPRLYPRQSPRRTATTTGSANDGTLARKDYAGLLSREQLRLAFAGFWVLMALLQIQLYWWQPGQISQTIGAMVGQGGWNSVLVDPALRWLSDITTNGEISLNIALIIVFLGLGSALAVVKDEQVRPFLVASIVVSLIIWWGAQAFGMIFTGMATDFNSGLLLVVIALACWPVVHQPTVQERPHVSEMPRPEPASRSV